MKDKRPTFTDCHGFTDSVKWNGSDNLRHFGGALQWGKWGARGATAGDLWQKTRQKKDEAEMRERDSEISANRLGGKASNKIEDELGKHAKWYKEDERDDDAWQQAKHLPGKYWRKYYCGKPSSN